MELLKELGCEIIPFSPLEDTRLPEHLDGLLFGGGYPELCAKHLAENRAMRKDVRKQIENGIPCIAECGGFLYLTEELEGEDGKHYPMVGALDVYKRQVLTQRAKPELMTCYEVVAAGRYPYTGRLGILTREDEKKTQEALEIVHATEYAEKSFEAISDGQRQRILLARAICQEPVSYTHLNL